jgi:hypothetical protein
VVKAKLFKWLGMKNETNLTKYIDQKQTNMRLLYRKRIFATLWQKNLSLYLIRVYPNLAQISRGLSKEKSENLKKIVTAAYTVGAAYR